MNAPITVSPTTLFITLFGSPRTFQDRIQSMLATGFGVGLVPKIPGTAASALALLVLYVPTASINAVLLSGICAAFVVGLWVVPTVERLLGDDPPCVVVDEFVGMWIALASPVIPRSAVWICAAFLLFRVFDIVKVYPANLLNARRGAFFVMADDVVAGFYASLAVHFLWLTYQLFDFHNVL
jgi:phosphatidylglycerophosphatase A